MAAQITKAGNGNFYGMGIGIRDARHMSSWFDLPCLAGAPGLYEIDYRIGRFTFGTDSAYARIVKLLLGLKSDGSVYPNESVRDDSNLYIFFAQGKYAMFMCGSWAIGNLKQEFPDFQNYRVISLPIPDEGRKGGMLATPGVGTFCMSSQTKHPNEAWLLLDWLSSRGFHERMMTKGLNLSVYPELLTPAYIADRHKWQAYEAAVKYTVFGPSPPVRNPQTALVAPKPVSPDVGDVLIGIYTGQITDWQKALKDLEARKQTAFEAAIQQVREAGANVSLDDFVFPDWDPMQNYVSRPK
jgi:ABC-type glycerol-3-phosphate transport system substrate-binding protein